MTYQIFLVEDEQNLNQVLTSYLQKEGWQVTPFFTGRDAQKVIGQQPHLWILDIMLPEVDGYQLIGEIKAKTPSVPVIFISARDADIDRIVGLELGSDDYLAKPFLPRELVIRVRKLLERVYGGSKEVEGQMSTVTIGNYVVDESNRSVISIDGSQVVLTSKEFDALLYFVKNQRRALAREQLIKHIWGEDYYGTDRAVDDLIRRLRKKLPDLRIETLYGYGYRMVAP